MININNISFKYEQIPIIDNLNVKLSGNTAVIGKSGCGKTTLLHLIAGILTPDKGSISINEFTNKEYRNSIGLVMQKGNVFPYKTVYENISLGLQIKKDNNISDKVNIIAKKLGLHDKLTKYPKELSGGQVQRTALGRVLCLKPNLLLLDEPFSSLDEITRQGLQDEIINISYEENIPVVTVTHSIQEAVILGDTVMVMDEKGNMIKSYNTKIYTKREMDYYNMCMHIDREIRRILL